MHSAVWSALLRHLPEKHHDQLMLVTSAGTEICVQCLLRVDAEFLAVKGRLAGSQDAGRVFFVPYAHLDYLGFQQPLTEAAFHEMFDTFRPPATSRSSLLLPPPAPGAAAAPKPPPAPPVPPGIKSVVLERFRNRSAPGPAGAGE